MITRHLGRLIVIASLSTAAAACGATAPSHFYTLEATATSDGAPAADYTVAVGPVTVPAAVDRPQFVIQTGPNRVSVDEFNRWAAPLNDAIARVVAGDLAALLGTPRVATAPLANFDPAYLVTLDIQRFDSSPGESVLVEAVWVVRASSGGTTGGGAVRSGRTVAREPVQGGGYDALAAAHSRALAQVSRDIATAIQAAAAATPHS
jgi:uncharacterized lipoprotein YmbA